MRILLLSSQRRLRCYENVRFKEEMKKIGVKVRIVVPRKFEIVANQIGEKSIFYNGKPLKLPDVLIPRYSLNYFSSAIIRQFERLNILVLNGSYSRELAKDKMASIQMLSSANLPVPKTILAKFPLDTDFIEANLKYPIVIKKTQGSEGKGIILCKNRNQLEDIFEMFEVSLEKNVNILLQEFVTKSFGKDIRVFVIGGRAIGAMLRTGKKGDFKANYSGGGTVKLFKLTPELKWLAVESAKAIGLDIAGVDILFDKDGYKLCEVNASPYFEGFEKATGINIPLEIYNYIHLKLGNK